MTYQDALDRALGLANHPAALEAFLDTVPAWRGDLEQAVGVSRYLGRELRAIAPGEPARLRSQQQLMATVSRMATVQAESPIASATKMSSLLTLPRILIAGATAGALLAFAVVVDVPSLGGGGTPTAEAEVIEGSVSAVGPDGVTINTSDASRVVRLSSNAVLTDSFGNTVEASKLSAGQDVVLKGSNSGNEFVANQVELRDRLFGVVTAMASDSIHLSSSKGNFTIFVTPETEFEGVVAVGSFVEVKLVRKSDGTLLALEIEVEDEDEGDDDHEGGDDRSGPSESSGPSGDTGDDDNDSNDDGGDDSVDDDVDDSHDDADDDD
jgi:hypothetical protein